MTDVEFLFVVVVAGAILTALATLPRWCFMTINRSGIWRLRDAIDADVRSGRLPSEHPAVHRLRLDVDRFLETLPYMTPMSMRRLAPLIDENDVQRHLDNLPSTSDLSERERCLIEEHRANLFNLVARNLVLNSWSGVLLLAVSVAAALARRGTPSLTIGLAGGVGVKVSQETRLASEIETAERIVSNPRADGPFGSGRPLVGAA